jgi:hypothetical protein
VPAFAGMTGFEACSLLAATHCSARVCSISPHAKGGLAERRRAASVAQNWAAIRRPAYAAILQPSATRAAHSRECEADDPETSTQGVWSRTPEAGPLSRQLQRAEAHRAARVRSAGFLRRRIPCPKRRSAARILMDEGARVENSSRPRVTPIRRPRASEVCSRSTLGSPRMDISACGTMLAAEG